MVSAHAMTMRPDVAIRSIGVEAQPLVTIDGFSPDPDGLRAAAIVAEFVPASQHYPGIRAGLPSAYLSHQLPIVARAMGRTFGRFRRLRVVDASFSIVTQSPAALRIGQRLPHVDAYGPDRIALIHYLSLDDGDGTAFYRHRSTGFETVDDARAPGYFERLDAEINGEGSPPAAYIAGDTALFTQTALAPAHYNRALVYRSHLLHSGAIAPDALLSTDPAMGRLTVTAFLAIE